MKKSTYISYLFGWIIGGVISYFIFGFDLKMEVGLVLGGAVMLTVAYLTTKKENTDE